MRKGILATAVFLLALLPFAPPTAYAHFPATDGTMTTILHVDPDDAPIPGQPATLYFIFEDATGMFQLANCACTLSVSQQGKIGYLAPLTTTAGSQASVYNADAPYTFPAQGIYHIVLTGEPLSPGAFQPFELAWDFRVDQAAGSSQDFRAKTFLTYFAGIAGGLLVVGAIILALEPDRKRPGHNRPPGAK